MRAHSFPEKQTMIFTECTDGQLFLWVHVCALIEDKIWMEGVFGNFQVLTTGGIFVPCATKREPHSQSIVFLLSAFECAEDT